MCQPFHSHEGIGVGEEDVEITDYKFGMRLQKILFNPNYLIIVNINKLICFFNV